MKIHLLVFFSLETLLLFGDVTAENHTLGLDGRVVSTNITKVDNYNISSADREQHKGRGEFYSI